jgi:adenosylhomocysteine nucleosidase
MKVTIQICSKLEWECTKSILAVKKKEVRRQPFGGCFWRPIGSHEAVIFESGATKTRSAAACQYAIDTWRPDAVINLGTCGGVARSVRKRTILLVTKTFQYDVIQRFGKPSPQFLRSLKANIDTSWVDLTRVRRVIRTGAIASADQDLEDEHRGPLQSKGVLAADWESASIATVCKLNKIRCLILRGVSDIPEKNGRPKEGLQERDYQKNTRIIMRDLFGILRRIVLR